MYNDGTFIEINCDGKTRFSHFLLTKVFAMWIRIHIGFDVFVYAMRHCKISFFNFHKSNIQMNACITHTECYHHFQHSIEICKVDTRKYKCLCGVCVCVFCGMSMQNIYVRLSISFSTYLQCKLENRFLKCTVCGLVNTMNSICLKT